MRLEVGSTGGAAADGVRVARCPSLPSNQVAAVASERREHSGSGTAGGCCRYRGGVGAHGVGRINEGEGIVWSERNLHHGLGPQKVLQQIYMFICFKEDRYQISV